MVFASQNESSAFRQHVQQYYPFYFFNTPYIEVSVPHTYTLTITKDGCSSSQNQKLANYPLPVIRLTNTPLCPLDTIILNAATTGCTYLWENGDTTATQVVSKPIFKSVTLTNAYACSSTKTIQVYLIESLDCDPGIYIPNAFTPDKDGHNEIFLPLFREGVLDKYEFSIYNSIGECIFKSTLQGEGWNGNYLNIPSPDGIYVWTLKYSYIYTTNTKEIFGTVKLLR